MRLMETITAAGRVLSAPLTGYPTVTYIGETVEAGVKDADVQTAALLAYHKACQPDVLFPFMDLSVEAEALGLPVRFKSDDGPDVTDHPVIRPEDLAHLTVPPVPETGRYRVYLETVRRLKTETDALVGGYVASPFTLAGLLMSAEKLAMNTLLEPDFGKQVIQFATRVCIPYAQAQAEAGADFVVLLEPTAALLSPELYEQFVGPYVQQVLEALTIPVVLHVCGQTTKLIPSFVKNDVQGLSLDSDVNLGQIAPLVPDNIAIIGNIAPVDVMLSMDDGGVYRKTTAVLELMKHHTNYVASTGCDVPPATAPENLMAFNRAVQDFNKERQR